LGAAFVTLGTLRRVLPPCLALTAALLIADCGTTPPSRGPAYRALSAEQSSDIAIHVMGLVGTPYRYGGNTPESGFSTAAA
jgi:cell wall-associated NlpC family hydrolase